MSADLFGPMSFRRHDLDLVIGSDINDRLAELQDDEDFQYVIYGDRIFMFESHILRAHMGNEEYLTAFELLENKTFPKVRIAVEWDFGHTSKLGLTQRKHIDNDYNDATCYYLSIPKCLR